MYCGTDARWSLSLELQSFRINSGVSSHLKCFFPPNGGDDSGHSVGGGGSGNGDDNDSLWGCLLWRLRACTRARRWIADDVRTSKDGARKNGEVTWSWARRTQQERELRERVTREDTYRVGRYVHAASSKWNSGHLGLDRPFLANPLLSVRHTVRNPVQRRRWRTGVAVPRSRSALPRTDLRCWSVESYCSCQYYKDVSTYVMTRVPCIDLPTTREIKGS